MFGIGYDNMDQSQGHIGCDLLDIGSRRAATRGRCAHQSEGAQAVPTLKLGEPGAFDLPNVPDVSGTPLLLLGVVTLLINELGVDLRWSEDSLAAPGNVVAQNMRILGLGVFRRTLMTVALYSV